ncbi:MAG: insulinase family protein [Bacteroidales bacterium]|nr:insulinase family protein [Bacteroidales bacterium]
MKLNKGFCESFFCVVCLSALMILLVSSCGQEKYRLKTGRDANGYTYEYVTQDPLKARIYILDNGLKVYMSYMPDEPRVATLIGVRAGSTSDPYETTGLAHYFEHMMFKGTDQIGTLNWEREKELLDQISALFEQHRATEDSAEKKDIYRKIDSVSTLAAGLVAANEYDKMVSSLGAKRTNAGTSYESTVYMNDIPSNELEKWLVLESERFRDIVLRLFHTELETVYEEFNMYQDNDMSRANKALMAGLFPVHPYGRDVIGLPEHLKNPSMVNIYEFAKMWYVPNNMAIALSGDLDFEKTILLIDKYFGDFISNPDLPDLQLPVEEPVTEPVIREVIGPDAEALLMAYRFAGENSEDEKYVTLIDMILSNSQAGLIDLDLNQKQKVLRAGSSAWFMRDYGIHNFMGRPREGQTLEEVRDLILGEIEKVKNGEFDDWMIEAVVNDMKLSRIRSQERNFSRAYEMMGVFISRIPYTDHLAFLDEISKIAREDLIRFAQENYKDNYVIVYKRTGESKGVVKVEKPEMTPVQINREDQSEFYKAYMEMPSDTIRPVFVDFDDQITQDSLKSGIPFYYIRNQSNELFEMQYIIDMGSKHDLNIPLAVNYLPYLGTDRFAPPDLQKEFFRLGLSMNVYAGDERCYISISGLMKSFEKGIELMEHVLQNVQPDQQVYDDYVDGILKSRTDAKLNKSTILWNGMFNYGKFGKDNPFTHILSEDELRAQKPEELTGLLKEICSFEHLLFYYGPQDLGTVTPLLNHYHGFPGELKPCPEPLRFPELATDETRIFFVNYDMVQTSIVMLSRGPGFNQELIPPARLFGEYFGSGLSSIVFQEIRESRALAYSAYAVFSTPSRKEDSHYVYGFVGTQADKLKIATDAMLGLMNDMPRAEKQFELAKESIIKQIDSERIIKTNIFWTYLGNRDKGIDHDIRKDIYDYAHHTDLERFGGFFNEHIRGNHYIFLVMGNRDLLDMNVLSQLGPVTELSLKEVFNY